MADSPGSHAAAEGSGEPGAASRRAAGEVSPRVRRTTGRRRVAVGPDPRRIILFVTGAVVVTLLLVATYAPRQQEQQQAAAISAERARALRAFRVATGTLAIPPPGQEGGDYLKAVGDAKQSGSPLAFSVWVDQDSFEQRAWRDFVQVGRFPLSRPPEVDFLREVAVVVWPVPGSAPESALRANGLTVEGVQLQHFALELRVGTDTGGVAPATPVGTSGAVPYGIFTIPRIQWPLPQPPPTEPPLAVTLVR
jgi:hypothetical protein